MTRFSSSIFSGAAILFGLAASPSFATVVSYTDAASWNAAVNSATLTTDNFNCATCSITQYPSFSNGTNGVTFSGSAAGGFSGVYWLNYASYGGTVLAGGPTDGGTSSNIWAVLPANTTAVSLGIAVINSIGGTATIKADGTLIGSVAITNTPNFTFYGITSTSNIGTITVSSLSGQVVIDNVSFGSVASVSGGGAGGLGDTGGAGGTATADATTLLLAGSGLTALGCGRRWLRLS